MAKKETIKRYILFIIGLFFAALGVAFTKHAELGVSPIFSVPNVISCKFTTLTMGKWLMVWNFILLSGQILILRRNFKPINFLQIPVSFLFGYFTDFGLLCIPPAPTDIYAVRILLVVLGIIVLGFGIALSVIANVIMNAGEAFVKTVADFSGKKFGNVKTVFDISNVSLAIILSLILFDFTIVGARECTLLATLGTGTCVKFFTKLLNSKITSLLIR